MKIRNSLGKVIGCAWVTPEYADELLINSWDWLDKHDRDDPAPTVPMTLRLVR